MSESTADRNDESQATYGRQDDYKCLPSGTPKAQRVYGASAKGRFGRYLR